jgi:hypothetical protein
MIYSKQLDIYYITRLSGQIHLKSTYAYCLDTAIWFYFDYLTSINLKWALICQPPRELL